MRAALTRPTLDRERSLLAGWLDVRTNETGSIRPWTMGRRARLLAGSGLAGQRTAVIMPWCRRSGCAAMIPRYLEEVVAPAHAVEQPHRGFLAASLAVFELTSQSPLPAARDRQVWDEQTLTSLRHGDTLQRVRQQRLLTLRYRRRDVSILRSARQRGHSPKDDLPMAAVARSRPH